MHTHSGACICMHMHAEGACTCIVAFERMHTHSDALRSILTYPDAFECILPYSQTLAVPLISKKCIGWIGQLLKLSHAWALHGDGKHKLHIGGSCWGWFAV